jgi:hypothetical protein
MTPHRQFVNGDKLDIVITLHAELITDLDSISREDIFRLMFADEAYGLKSIVAGNVSPKSDPNDHDTEINWNSTELEIVT